MLAFYGWTDTLLINLVNTKLSYYRDEPADLFVLGLDRVSDDLIREIEQAGIFQHVFLLYLPPFHIEKGPLTLWEKVKRLFAACKYRRHYHGLLAGFAGKTVYQTLFTGAFWSETLFLYSYFRRFSPSLEIRLVEEGLTNYNSPHNWQFQCMPQISLKERLMRCVYYGDVFNEAKSRVRCVYLYTTELRRGNPEIPVCILPPVTEHRTCHEILFQLTSAENRKPYREHSIFFLGGAISYRYEDTFDRTYQLLEAVLQASRENAVLVKAHPCHCGENDEFAVAFESMVLVDRSGLSFESLCLDINMNDKLLIARNSMCALSMKNMLGMEPYVVLTYQLYEHYQQHGEHIMDEFSADLKHIYTRPEKILVPHSVEELREIIQTFFEGV